MPHAHVLPTSSTSPPTCSPCCSDTDTEPRADPQLEALTLAVAADLPVLLWGEPGIGKTAALTQLAAALDLPLTTVIASVHEPSDFSGLPIVGDDPAEPGRADGPAGLGGTPRPAPAAACCSSTSCPPRRRPCRPRCCGWCSNAGSAACGCRPACGSWPPRTRRSSAADGWDLSPPLANRFVHLQWTHDHDGRSPAASAGPGPVRSLPRLDPRAAGAAPSRFARRARRAGCSPPGPGLVHQLPGDARRRGGAVAVAAQLGDGAAADSRSPPPPAPSRDALVHCWCAARSATAPGLELLAGLDQHGPARPRARCSPTRPASPCPTAGDLRQAVLDGVVAAVRKRPDQARWDAALGGAGQGRVDTGVPDLVVVPATTLAALRRVDWDVPA